MSADLAGKTAIVTGGSRGLGRAMVLGLADAGVDVVVASRHLETCEAVAELARQRGVRALAVQCHVGEWASVESLAERVLGEWGHVDVLVNNAGMSPLYESIDQVTEALWDKVFDVNLKGHFRLSAIIGTHMAAHSGGSIINVSSGGAVRPNRHIVPYAAAKAAVNTITIGLAHTLGPKVRVNCIQAGPFATDVVAHWRQEEIDQQGRTFALGRMGQPEEIVGTVLWLASDASSFVTGAVVPVDGGMP